MAGETGTTTGGTGAAQGGQGSSSGGTTTTESKGAQGGAGGAGTTQTGSNGASGQQKGSTQDPKGNGAQASGTGGEKSPATAELELKLPEGVEVDSEMLGAFKTMAKEANLNGEAAQKVVDIYVTAQQAAQRKATESWTQTQKQWVEEIQNDKELGGANAKAAAIVTEKAVKALVSPELSKFLDQSGLGNHPEMARLFHRLGKMMKEDTIAGSSATQGSSTSKPTEQELARRRYNKTWPTTP